MKRRIIDTVKPLRVLMILAADGTGPPSIWATRQIDSLKAVGVQAHSFIFRDRRTLSGLVKGGLALRRKARECKADLIHVHYGAAQALIAVFFSSKPVIVSFCGSDLLGNYDSSGRKTWSGFLSAFLSQLSAVGCRRCIAKTEELKSALWLSSCRDKCQVIPNGVDLNQFKPMRQTEARSALGWAHNDPVVLFMDRSGDWVKDPHLAQAAYNEAKKCVSSLRMHVVEQEPPEKMPLFYNAADVLLLTSRHEGSNNTVKEALACNLPVVATACGDISERLHGVHCCYVSTRDRQQLGRWLARVATSRERGNGREHIQELALHRVAMRIVGCYEEALLSDGTLCEFELRNKLE